jgi:hypothetical protein
MRNPAAQLEAALKARARNGARHAAVMGIAVLLLLTGAGFLTSALWIAAAATWSPLVASLLLAMVCLVAGAMIFLQVIPPQSLRKPASPQSSHQSETGTEPPPLGDKSPYPPLAEAFLFGLNTAIRLRRRRDRAPSPTRDR